MKPATGVVLLLVAVVLLYAAALALGVAVNRGGGKPSAGGGDDWLAGLGNMTSAFATPLDVSRLQCRVEVPGGGSGKSQPVAQRFALNEDDAACTIRIPHDSREDYRHASLEVQDTPAAQQLGVYLRANCDDDEVSFCERGRKTCFRDGETIPHAFRLEVTFEPLEDPNCWLQRDRDDQISVTVLEDGGALTLECIGCDADAKRRIDLLMQ